MSQKIYCIAEFQPKSGKEQELFELIMSLESRTLREDGCIRYCVTRQIARPNTEYSPSLYSIVINEEFTNIEAFNKHGNMWYIKDFFDKYIANPETSIAINSNVRIFTDEPFVK